uniref:IS66-like element accessory protein TnpA n=1 Tax=Marinobacterium profundum TaxID=1714300 RepID=UPI000A57D4BF|nr:transposase [Marinobacterium profundum]
MMTSISVTEAPNKRRRYTTAFKARIIAACQEPNASVARIALDHGLNANLVHKWIRAARQQPTATSPAFVALAVPAQSDQQTALGSTNSIRIEIPRPAGNVVVNVPVAQADRCLLWLQELLR